MVCLGSRNRYTFLPLFVKEKREMLWVVSLIYPVFLGLIFHECFFSKKGYNKYGTDGRDNRHGVPGITC